MSLEDDKPASEWLDHIEASCQSRGIRQSDWPRIASHFLPKDLRLAMLERLRHLMLFGISEWSWDLFKRDLLTLCGEQYKSHFQYALTYPAMNR
jgi:hypothetical protein